MKRIWEIVDGWLSPPQPFRLVLLEVDILLRASEAEFAAHRICGESGTEVFSESTSRPPAATPEQKAEPS
jgi:hypothetical protein